MSQDKKVGPFTKSFVLNATLKHMQNAIDISNRKAVARMQDFDSQSEKGVEILETLSVLNTMSKLLSEFKEHNPSLFK